MTMLTFGKLKLDFLFERYLVIDFLYCRKKGCKILAEIDTEKRKLDVEKLEMLIRRVNETK